MDRYMDEWMCQLWCLQSGTLEKMTRHYRLAVSRVGEEGATRHSNLIHMIHEMRDDPKIVWSIFIIRRVLDSILEDALHTGEHTVDATL